MNASWVWCVNRCELQVGSALNPVNWFKKGKPAVAWPYPVGRKGEAWTEADKEQWRKTQVKVLRSYETEVLTAIRQIGTRREFEVVQYGALSQDASRYPLFAVKTVWDASKPYVLITGGVHGYETSGVQGVLQFINEKAVKYSEHFNLLIFPCVSPWAYECIQRWTINAVDPNRSFHKDGQSEEATAVMKLVEAQNVTWLCHIDCHETTDTDESEFSPAKAARDGASDFVPDIIPDGFYLVGDIKKPELEWHKAMIDSVKKVHHTLNFNRVFRGGCL
jgi:hypothetical protein